jgi:hypothetical protein
MTRLKSADLITTDTAATIFGRHRVEGTRELSRHDVEVYRVTYATGDADGPEVAASGEVLIPKASGKVPLMCYCRGTIIPVHVVGLALQFREFHGKKRFREMKSPDLALPRQPHLCLLETFV